MGHELPFYRALRRTVFLNPHPPTPAEFLTRTASSRNLRVPLPPAPAMFVSTPARSHNVCVHSHSVFKRTAWYTHTKRLAANKQFKYISQRTIWNYFNLFNK